MAFDRWRIGMDMEPDVLRALALSRDRAEWRCRGWWQFTLPMARDDQGAPCPVAVTVDALRRRRRQLPRRLSSLPAALAWDWCLDAAHPDRVLIVSVRLSVLLPWRRCLRAAGLPVHRLDIAAAALRRMARACDRHPALPLVHQCASGAYHVAPLVQPLDFVFGTASAAACHFTRTEPGAVPEGGELWSPFDVLRAASERPSAPRERRWPRGGMRYAGNFFWKRTGRRRMQHDVAGGGNRAR